MDLDEGPFVGQHISTRTIAIWEAYVWGLKKGPSVQNGIEAPVKNYTSHKFRQVELARKTFEKQVELNETSRIESKMDQKGVFFSRMDTDNNDKTYLLSRIYATHILCALLLITRKNPQRNGKGFRHFYAPGKTFLVFDDTCAYSDSETTQTWMRDHVARRVRTSHTQRACLIEKSPQP